MIFSLDPLVCQLFNILNYMRSNSELIFRLQYSQVVPEQTERHQRRHMGTTHFQWPRHQTERGLGETEEDQGSQRSETLLGTQGQRSEDKGHRQNRQNTRSHQEEGLMNNVARNGNLLTILFSS